MASSLAEPDIAFWHLPRCNAGQGGVAQKLAQCVQPSRGEPKAVLFPMAASPTPVRRVWRCQSFYCTWEGTCRSDLGGIRDLQIRERLICLY